MNAPCVFAGDVLFEDNSILSLIAKGKQKIIDAENKTQKTIDTALQEIPQIVKSNLRKNEIKVEYAFGDTKSVSFIFDLPELKEPFYITVYVNVDDSKNTYRVTNTYFYYTGNTEGYTIKRAAPSLEEALFLAYEFNKIEKLKEQYEKAKGND